MPVNVTLADRNKKKAGEEALPPAALDDYAAPEEKREGFKALAIWLLFIVVIVALGYALGSATKTPGIAIGIFVWWLVTCIGYFFIGPKIVLRRLRQEENDPTITSRNEPHLKSLLGKGSGVLGIDEPEGYLLAEGVSQVRVFGPPHFVLITQEVVDLLHQNELDCLVLRSMVHIRQGHTRRLMLLKFLNDTPPPARFLAWPVGLYAFFLRMWWTDLAEQTADRLTLLLVKNNDILKTALLKQQTATDPIMQQNEITPADVDAYVKQAGRISLEGKEISTQYKLGQAIHENPFLEDRLQQLDEWAKSPEFKIAIERLAEARAKRPALSK